MKPMHKKSNSGSDKNLKNIAGFATREVAADAFLQVLKSRATLEDVLEPLKREAGLDDRDSALAKAIATTALRRYGSLKHFIYQRLDQKHLAFARLEAILITAAAQILHMDVPDRAAVDLAVRLARADKTLRGFSGLTNAVLRRIAKERNEIAEQDDPLLDVPQWLQERWLRFYGAEKLQAIAAGHRAGASVDISVKSDAAGWAKRLDASQLVTGSLRLGHKTAVTELEGFQEGEWWIQDAAAALPVRLLAPVQGERIADLCAAPGGKTAQIAATGAEVIAIDRSAPRLKRLRENMDRLGFQVDVRVKDILNLEDETFDAILLDAPCSATGTLRRHPEIAWTKAEDDIAKLVELQGKLLEKSAGMLKVGGRLIYCTCSLEAEEGENRIEAFLAANRNFKRIPVTPEEISLPDAVNANGDMRTLPYMDVGENLKGLDGFFAARLQKVAE
ncbi:transcription antitermination factor NusB [Microvirga sp. W0021]|uniref:Transcription antitermination factor NusB n=1 Tax=Hohaiivirga grylli TaxID=3133970 RepID=A0ABV0BHB0_9HYPH